MTATASPRAGPPAAVRLHLSELLRQPVLDPAGAPVGRLTDVVVTLRGADVPLVTGLVVAVAGRPVFVPVEAVAPPHDGEPLRLTTPRVDLRPFARRPREVLLSTDVLGHRLVDIEQAQLVRAYDVELVSTPAGWVPAGVDTRRPRRLLGRGRPPRAHAHREWKAFEALIGHRPSATVRGPFARVRRLHPAQIADLLEQASAPERQELLADVRGDPELEADVFEELDDDRQTRLLAERSDAEVADLLARMRPDDAADAVMELSQERRQAVLDLLPAPARRKVLTLLGYNETTAGGLMGIDYLALPATYTVGAALAAVATSRQLQPEALTTVYCLDPDDRVTGAATLVKLVQADPAAPLSQLADPASIQVPPSTDLIDIACLMSDYNLLTLPVVDDQGRLLGLITVDDVLEATVPGNWHDREPRPPLHQAELR